MRGATISNVTKEEITGVKIIFFLAWAFLLIGLPILSQARQGIVHFATWKLVIWCVCATPLCWFLAKRGIGPTGVLIEHGREK